LELTTNEDTEMNVKLQVLSCCIVALIGCSDSNKSASTTTNKTNYNNVVDSTISEKKASPSDYTTKLPEFLDQNWDHETRMEWWYTSQGSRLLPYDWFFALEQPNSKKLISAKENLEQFRFISWPADSKWNPDGLPIGFVADKDTATGTRYLGFTCATCHTGKIAYQGKEYLVEGAPAHHDFDRFTTEIATSMQTTLNDSDKFSRFAKRVLGAKAKPDDIAALKELLTRESSKHIQRVAVNRHSSALGYARLDAFGNIFNEAAVFAINELSNAKPADAPVSYPMLWDTPQHDVVQWNGAAVNAGIGPYSRNAGEVVGVFGDLHIEKGGTADAPEMIFKHHIKVNALTRLEEILTTLWSPLWPEKSLPAIDQTKAQNGKALFETNCGNCHLTIKRDDPQRNIVAQMIPLTAIGTDPTMATNIISRKSKTGILEGQPVLPLSKLVPNLNKLGSEALTVQVVRYGVVGILVDGLDPVILNKGLSAFLGAAQKNATRQVSYKARPLNGIWASAPFLHNGSVPNLWELLQKPEQRVTSFNVGSWKMDPVKVGFATDAEPATSKFDTLLPGNSNKGHEYGSQLSDKEKWELIEYLKTL
jgi:mono/diheme cytochrome c family protein